jgi:hypothetical protein
VQGVSIDLDEVVSLLSEKRFVLEVLSGENPDLLLGFRFLAIELT